MMSETPEDFPFRYQGGGWFRDSTVQRGEPAPMLHGNEATDAAMRFAEKTIDAEMLELLMLCQEALTAAKDRWVKHVRKANGRCKTCGWVEGHAPWCAIALLCDALNRLAKFDADVEMLGP